MREKDQAEGESRMDVDENRVFSEVTFQDTISITFGVNEVLELREGCIRPGPVPHCHDLLAWNFSVEAIHFSEFDFLVIVAQE